MKTMPKTFCKFLFFFLIVYKNECMSPLLIFRPQTKEEAFSYVMNIMEKSAWYQENGYEVRIPDHALFEQNYLHPHELTIDECSLRKVFSEKIYPLQSFENAYIELEETQHIIKLALEELATLNQNWNFKIWPTYQILLTLYGPGGSYNWQTGFITLLSDEHRCHPLHKTVIIHEIVHLGIEENIVQKYHLTHWEKERLVDLICKKYLSKIMPSYNMQRIDDCRIDEFATYHDIINNLPDAIEKFIIKVPR